MTPMSEQIACTEDEICNSASLAVTARRIMLETSTTSNRAEAKINAIEPLVLDSTSFLDEFQANFNAN